MGEKSHFLYGINYAQYDNVYMDDHFIVTSITNIKLLDQPFTNKAVELSLEPEHLSDYHIYIYICRRYIQEVLKGSVSLPFERYGKNTERKGSCQILDVIYDKQCLRIDDTI